jgi:hypothetical protein
VESIELNSPDGITVTEWEEEALNSFREDDWLGNPTYSSEIYIVNSGRPVNAESFSRLEDMAQDLDVMMAVKDVESDTWDRAMQEESFQKDLQVIEENMQEGFRNMEAYLSRMYEASSRDIDSRFFYSDAELENMRPVLSVCGEMEQQIRKSEDYVMTGAELYGSGRSDDSLDALDKMDENICFYLYFRYSGNEEAVEEYNSFTDEWGDDQEYSGVPGMVIVGNGSSSRVFVPNGSEIGLSYSEIEQNLSSKMEGILAAREGIEK